MKKFVVCALAILLIAASLRTLECEPPSDGVLSMRHESTLFLDKPVRE